ncbi:SMP-30/gluconolactonase/LRE family protein [Jiangella asiatica]|uniref:SMP-30/gluconolactonase/LRE family protein n=1 Tax=Jiangella asiatica TaxID=2530372 RepID=A0A4R5D8N5_9ACTN|nr:SMP-30/gluconolactonase/LRE family protein [Jiangella asiatica]TDE09929.1 SMP-30/gluconolactonase/LRE family protein [Jiangella asiatica]
MTIEVFFDGLLSEPRLDHPEGVAVHPDGSVWCGGERGQIYRIEDGRIEQVASTGGFCLGLAFDSQANLYVCDLAHAALFRLPAHSDRPERFADGADGRRFVGPNFPAVDAADRVLVSDNGHADRAGPGIFAFEPDGAGRLWHAGPFHFANGLAFDADDTVLYVAETWARRVTAIDVRPDGSAGRSHVVVELPGMLPDGLAVDARGRLVVTCYEPSRLLSVDPNTGDWSVLAEDPDAHLLCHPTNAAFQGDALLVANLGRWHLSRIPGVGTGLPLPAFRRPLP